MAVLESPIVLVPAPELVSRDEPTFAAEHPVPARDAFLAQPKLDTWLVGGLSIAVFAVVASLSPMANTVPSIGTQIRNLALIAPTLALLVNYPHFMASYRLAYWRRDAAIRHSFALAFVPAVLVIATLLAFVTFDSPRRSRRTHHRPLR